MAGKPLRLSKGEEIQLGKDLFNRTWVYLRKRRRSKADVEAMVNAAHASAHFWSHVGKPSNFAISEWQLSRVHVVAGHPAEGLRHAKSALARRAALRIDEADDREHFLKDFRTLPRKARRRA